MLIEGKGMEELRGALIGAGFFARNHMQAWRDLAAQGARIVGVCDLDPTKAREMAEEYGAAPFTDPAAMLDALSDELEAEAGVRPVRLSGATGAGTEAVLDLLLQHLATKPGNETDDAGEGPAAEGDWSPL